MSGRNLDDIDSETNERMEESQNEIDELGNNLEELDDDLERQSTAVRENREAINETVPRVEDNTVGVEANRKDIETLGKFRRRTVVGGALVVLAGGIYALYDQVIQPNGNNNGSAVPPDDISDYQCSIENVPDGIPDIENEATFYDGDQGVELLKTYSEEGWEEIRDDPEFDRVEDNLDSVGVTERDDVLLLDREDKEYVLAEGLDEFEGIYDNLCG